MLPTFSTGPDDASSGYAMNKKRKSIRKFRNETEERRF
jgi:hypothetical protein